MVQKRSKEGLVGFKEGSVMVQRRFHVGSKKVQRRFKEGAKKICRFILDFGNVKIFLDATFKPSNFSFPIHSKQRWKIK